ncbi:MAG: hypothetical protein V1723_04185 [Candidatus Uhrbacteria bacterium]
MTHGSVLFSGAAHPSLQVVYFCDTTGSMYPYFNRVRASLRDIIERVGRERTRVESAVYAYKNHGDEQRFFDGTHPFAYQPFSADTDRIAEMLGAVRQGGGGDGLCAVEDAYHHAADAASLQPRGAAKRVAVVIGDMPPHGVLDCVARCPHEYDYRQGVAQLQRLGFTFYSVFCGVEDEFSSERKQKIREYFRWLPRTTGGTYLDLTDIDSLADILTGICMKETGSLASFLAEVERRPALPQATRRLLAALSSPGEHS